MKNLLKKIGSNRRLVAGRLEIDFKKPFDLLAKLPAEARGEAPSEATNSIWWTRWVSNPQPRECHSRALASCATGPEKNKKLLSAFSV